MSSSSASVTVANSPNMYAGGLVGSQGYGSVEDSYSTGEISNEPPDYFVFTSGITSYQFHNTIKNTYAAGHLSTSNAATYTRRGGIGAFGFETTIEHSFLTRRQQEFLPVESILVERIYSQAAQ